MCTKLYHHALSTKNNAHARFVCVEPSGMVVCIVFNRAALAYEKDTHIHTRLHAFTSCPSTPPPLKSLSPQHIGGPKNSHFAKISSLYMLKFRENPTERSAYVLCFMPHLAAHERDLIHGFGAVVSAPPESKVDVGAYFSFDDVLELGHTSSKHILLQAGKNKKNESRYS